MTIGLLGDALPARIRGLLSGASIRIIAPARAALRVYVGARPPSRSPQPPWVWAVTARRGKPPAIDRDLAAAATLGGAYDVIAVDAAFAGAIAQRLAELAVRLEPGPPPVGFIAFSERSKRFVAELDRAARTSMAVLLTGETGTGKDLAARHLHARSGRRGDLVPINCAAIPNDLIEGELFGYVRGAFSGASHDYDGLLHAARDGTVFLDEVDDTPKTLQMKLLRVLEDHTVSRLGESAWRQVDFRIVAATNRDLADLVRRGEFGVDLYQRLAIIRIEVPPLRDRPDDIGELSAHMVARFYREEPAAPHRVDRVSPAAHAALVAYPWPGNVRELRNVIFQSLVGKRTGTELLLSDLPEHVVRGVPPDGIADPTAPGGDDRAIDPARLARLLDANRMNLRELRDELERTALGLALARAGGSPARAARLLGEVGRGASRDPGGRARDDAPPRPVAAGHPRDMSRPGASARASRADRWLAGCDGGAAEETMKRTVLLGTILAVSALSTTAARADTRVLIESDNDEVTLNQITSEASASAYGPGGSAHGSSMGFHVVCRAPCNERVSSRYKYFIDGEGMPRSRKFLLPVDGQATLRVNAGNSATFFGGVTFAALGGISTLTGLLVLPITPESSATSRRRCRDPGGARRPRDGHEGAHDGEGDPRQRRRPRRAPRGAHVLITARRW